MAKKEKKGLLGHIVTTLVLTAVSTGIAVIATLVAKKLADKGLPESKAADTANEKDKKEEPGEEQYIILNNDEVEETTEENIATEPGTIE